MFRNLPLPEEPRDPSLERRVLWFLLVPVVSRGTNELKYREIDIDFAKSTWSIAVSRSSRAWVASSRAKSRSFRRRSTSNCNSSSVDRTIPIWSPPNHMSIPTTRPRMSRVSQLPERVRTIYLRNETIVCFGVLASVVPFPVEGRG